MAYDYNSGVYFNLNYDNYSTNIKNFGKPTCCPEWNSGTGRGFDIGALLYLTYTENLNLGIDIGFQSSSSTLRYVESEVINVAGEDFNGKFEHIANISYYQIQLRPSLIYDFYDELKIKTGIDLGYLFSPSFHQYEQITIPFDRGVFKDTKTRKRNEFSGDIGNGKSFQYGVFVSISYPLQLNLKNTIILNPLIEFNYNLSSIVADNKLTKYGIGLGFYILFE